jgi:calcyclin binding protein
MEQEKSTQPSDEFSTRSQERLLDALAIEEAASNMTRPTARMHLESLAKKLRKEAEALERVEKSQMHMGLEVNKDKADDEAYSVMDVEEKKDDGVSVQSTSPPQINFSTASFSSTSKYVPIDRFSFDAGGYNSQFVTVYISLSGVGSIDRNLISCQFNTSSFDLIIQNLHGKSYRLFQDNLEKDIDPSKSKFIVKSDKIILKLSKTKQSDYGGYDYWTKLSDKKAREKSNKMKDDPQSSIMDLMKQMYDEGDDNMKKIIGETMAKQQRGELGKDDPMKGLDKMDI